MQNHAFYMALAYGISALVLLLEVFALWRQCRSRRLEDGEKRS